MKPIIISIAGPSGAGKSFLANKLKEEHNFQEIVSTTTRNPRQGEIDGVHYHFVSKDEFLKLDAVGDLVEKNLVNGNYYGVSKEEALRLSKNNKPIALVIDPVGVVNVKKYCEQNDWISISIFVSSPIEVLKERMKDRIKNELKKLDPNSQDYKENAERIYKTNNDRLDHVINFEMKNWVGLAYSKDSPYDVVVDSFNEKNEKSVIEIIQNKIIDLKKENNEDLSRGSSKKSTPKMKI